MTQPLDDSCAILGLHDRLLSEELRTALAALDDDRLATLADVDPGEAHDAVAQYLELLIAGALSRHRGEEGAKKQRAIVHRILTALSNEMGSAWADGKSLADPMQRLLAVHASSSVAPLRPDTPLARSSLLTGARGDPSLSLQLQKEIASADRVDILCSFIKWSGLRLLLPALQRLVATPTNGAPRLRVITTSYMGATDPKAAEALHQLPHTEVRVSYDTARTRLHAKAYIIHRATGFGGAYIGSANISGAALSEGLEWTTKVSQFELPYLWQRINATFDTYWNDNEFEPLSAATQMKFSEAIQHERNSGTNDGTGFVAFDLKPFPFQEEILDQIAAERVVRKKTSHLIVAATGTGKTMVAAFDYKRWCAGRSPRPSLLFVAHREEILRQALGTFRAVLRDQNFGDMLVGGSNPAQQSHLFCSIQTYASRELWRHPADKFHYVVMDEFHHAAAPTYGRLLDHVRPQVLLGLTATPERSDTLDVFRWFGGTATAEIRLPDAISRRLLCPFQYFGVADADNTDLSTLRWQRGGYSTEDLDRVYTGNDVRAGLVLDKIREIVLDPTRMRALGFCVSVAHAQFMARFANDHGLQSIALSAESSDEERRSAKDRLIRREANILFVVDLYNEGIDIPEVDTVLFLRPTESLTVFLQQFGRGLRLHEEKDCLTVLDFIGQQRREFRFDARFRAISRPLSGRIDGEIEAGFPHLPSGCSVNLERVAQQRILENVRNSISLRRPRLIQELTVLAQTLGRAPTIGEAVDYFAIDLPNLLAKGLWSRLLHEAGRASAFSEEDEEQLAKGLLRISHLNDPRAIEFYLSHLDTGGQISDLDRRRLTMLHVSLWGSDSLGWTLEEAEARLKANPVARNDLRQVLHHLLRHVATPPRAQVPEISGPLALHAHYTRDEILVGLGHWSMKTRPDVREGVLHMPSERLDVFFITLNKTLEEYSATTMYEDYAISDSLFHWQSQSTTSQESPTGRRYIEHNRLRYTPLLFVREDAKLPSGRSAPYAFLGPADYMSHEGSKPISVVWRLRNPMPAALLRATARQIVG